MKQPAVLRKSIFAFINVVVIKLFSFAKFSFILGSYSAFFSMTATIMPIVGWVGGMQTAFFTFALSMIIRLLSGSFPLHFLAFYVPGLFAAYSLSTTSKIAKVIPSLLCIFLFICHPIGASAALYSLFWVIPIFCAFYLPQNIFAKALSSTFIAHAVGSVIWLYTVPMSANQWLMLIPIVMVERFFFAFLIVVGYKVVSSIQEHAKYLSLKKTYKVV